MISFTYDGSLSATQRQWIADAIARQDYPLDRWAAAVTFVSVAEPPCPGHSDMMCTVDNGDGTFTVNIRTGLEDPNGRIAQGLPNPANDIKLLFQESVVHELGHVVAFKAITTDDLRTTVASYFQRDVLGELYRTGALTDWNPLTVGWADRIQEAVAEVFKDAALPEQYRYFDNRTNWVLQKDHFTDLMVLLGFTKYAGTVVTYHNVNLRQTYPGGPTTGTMDGDMDVIILNDNVADWSLEFRNIAASVIASDQMGSRPAEDHDWLGWPFVPWPGGYYLYSPNYPEISGDPPPPFYKDPGTPDTDPTWDGVERIAVGWTQVGEDPAMPWVTFSDPYDARNLGDPHPSSISGHFAMSFEYKVAGRDAEWPYPPPSMQLSGGPRGVVRLGSR